jgi:hypothetical protein
MQYLSIPLAARKVPDYAVYRARRITGATL